MSWLDSLHGELMEGKCLVVHLGPYGANGDKAGYADFCIRQPSWGSKAAIVEIEDWICIPPKNDNFYGVDRNANRIRLAGTVMSFQGNPPLEPLADTLLKLQAAIMREGGKPDTIIRGMYAPEVKTRDSKYGPALKVISPGSGLGSDIYMLQSDTWSVLDGYHGSQLICSAPGYNGKITIV